MQDALKGMKAALFDMDGTLIDSMPHWRRMSYEYVLSRGIRPTEAEKAEMRQLSGMRIAQWMTERYGIEGDYEALSRAACAGMERIYAAGVEPKPGARAYLRRLGARGVLRAVVTATPARLALIALNGADLVRDLDLIVTTDMTGGWKGEAAFWQRMLDMTGVPAEQAILFEDSLYAVQAAAPLGIRSVAIADETNQADRPMLKAACIRVIDSYDALT